MGAVFFPGSVPAVLPNIDDRNAMSATTNVTIWQETYPVGKLESFKSKTGSSEAAPQTSEI